MCIYIYKTNKQHDHTLAKSCNEKSTVCYMVESLFKVFEGVHINHINC